MLEVRLMERAAHKRLTQNDSSPFIPQCFPRLFYLSFPPLSPTMSWVLVSYPCLTCTDDFWRCWVWLSHPSGGGKELGWLLVSHLSPGVSDNTWSFSQCCFPTKATMQWKLLDALPRVHHSFINFLIHSWWLLHVIKPWPSKKMVENLIPCTEIEAYGKQLIMRTYNL